MAAGAVKRGARASWHAERGQLGHRQHRRKARPPRKRLDDRSGQPLCRPREPEVGPGQRCAARRRERRDEDSPHGQSDPWHNQRHGGRRCGVDPASGSSLAGDGKHTPPEQREQTRGCSQTSGSGPLLAEWWAPRACPVDAILEIRPGQASPRRLSRWLVSAARAEGSPPWRIRHRAWVCCALHR